MLSQQTIDIPLIILQSVFIMKKTAINELLSFVPKKAVWIQSIIQQKLLKVRSSTSREIPQILGISMLLKCRICQE
jgi:hypothetical protein